MVEQVDIEKLKLNRLELFWLCSAIQILDDALNKKKSDGLTEETLDLVRTISSQSRSASEGFLWFARVGHCAQMEMEACAKVAAMIDSGFAFKETIPERLLAAAEIERLISGVWIELQTQEMNNEATITAVKQPATSNDTEPNNEPRVRKRKKEIRLLLQYGTRQMTNAVTQGFHGLKDEGGQWCSLPVDFFRKIEVAKSSTK